jgi:putative lipoprotein
MDPEDLIGYIWHVVEIDDEPVAMERPPAVEFTDEGRVVGSTGVNRLMGSYELAGDGIRLQQLATTMMAGAPEAMKTEARLVQAFSAGGAIEVQLLLRNEHSGNSLRLTRQPGTKAALPEPVAEQPVVEPELVETTEPMAAVSNEPLEEPTPDAYGAPQSATDERLIALFGDPIAIEDDGAPIVKGSVFYRERIAMPEGSVVTVRLLDTSRADAPASVIGEQVIAEPANVPVAFEIGYEPSVIDASHSYAVAAMIEVDGQVAWRSTIHHPVLTRGAGGSAVVMVTRAS